MGGEKGLYSSPRQKPGNADPIGAGREISLGIGHDRIRVAHDTRIGYGVHDLHDLRLIRQLKHAPLTGVRLEGGTKKAALARRRVTSMTCSCMRNASGRTETTGSSLQRAGPRRREPSLHLMKEARYSGIRIPPCPLARGP